MMSGYDANRDGKINSGDAIYNYIDNEILASTCREFKVANNISTCSLHVEQIIQNKKVA